MFTIKMGLVATTKGALRYGELGDQNKIGTLYLRKDGIEGEPKTIEVTVKPL